MVRAFGDLAKKYPQLELVFVGPDRGVLHENALVGLRQYARMHLEQSTLCRLVVAGQRSPQEIDDFRRNAAITVIASRYETFGNVALEASRLGCPIVATKVGGLAEILTEDETALLVEPNDAAALGAGISTLLENQDMAIRLGNAAVEDSHSRFAPVRIAAQTIEFYENVMARWRSSI